MTNSKILLKTIELFSRSPFDRPWRKLSTADENISSSSHTLFKAEASGLGYQAGPSNQKVPGGRCPPYQKGGLTASIGYVQDGDRDCAAYTRSGPPPLRANDSAPSIVC
ncbi:MAG: hypothetical protein GDA48_21645 [Hormoscilla sp. GM102CHS1]|nr:hypothetical protein [Hormoscilla sp. GM102CHS1]